MVTGTFKILIYLETGTYQIQMNRTGEIYIDSSRCEVIFKQIPATEEEIEGKGGDWQ